MRSAVVGERQLQDVLEIVREHREPAAMRQPVGIERNQRAAKNSKNGEAGPQAQQHAEARPCRRGIVFLRARQHVDDAAEQHRFGKLRDGQRNVGERQEPAQSAVRSELFEYAAVKAKITHAGKGRLWQ